MIEAIDLFAGVGGITSAFNHAGLRTLSVEKDPNNEGYSKMMQIAHRRNFPDQGFAFETVEQFASRNLDRIIDVKIVHGSPSCRHYTSATKNMGDRRPIEDSGDINSAIAYNKVIKKANPDYFTLEQVSEYKTSNAFALALEGLEDRYKIQVYNKIHMNTYGIPQARARLFVTGWIKSLKPLELPPRNDHKGWYSTVEGLECRETKLPPQCQEWTIREPLLLMPSKQVKFDNTRLPSSPFPTILRSHFVDQRGNSKTTAFKFVADGRCYIIPLRALARGQGFSDDFILPTLPVIAGQGVGNAFCPAFYKQFLKHNGIGTKHLHT